MVHDVYGFKNRTRIINESDKERAMIVIKHVLVHTINDDTHVVVTNLLQGNISSKIF